ncbi:MAG: class I SAM-dependent methyltransferase [Rhodocyclaceae bacterium]
MSTPPAADGNFLPDVRAQYEALPYPPVDPEDDRKRLARTWLDDLPMINHYCFAGRQRFDGGFRVLVAGGGTGDASIFLAEQLRDTDARIVHLDLSEASIAIAQRRAQIRGLDNITWLRESLLDLPTLGLEPFDYINCCGVLHHLADPDAGLRALRAVLKPDGAMGLMVYGQIGRTGVYQMQSLLRLASEPEEGIPARIDLAKHMLAGLPETNWFRRGDDLYNDHERGDAGIYDLLLHSQDRAYTVGELFDWLAQGHGLHLEFSDVHRGRAPYLPHLMLAPQQVQLAGRLRALPRRRQAEIAELIGGALTRHLFYATPGPACTAPYGDADYVPFFFHDVLNGGMLADIFEAGKKGQPVMLQHAPSRTLAQVDAGKYASRVLRQIDGKRCFGEIFERVRKSLPSYADMPDDALLFADFRDTFDALNAIDRMLLRHRDVPVMRAPG